MVMIQSCSYVKTLGRCGFMANAGNKNIGFIDRVGKFFRECWVELVKTSWPTKDELTKSTILVLIAILIMAVWMGGLDAILSKLTESMGI